MRIALYLYTIYFFPLIPFSSSEFTHYSYYTADAKVWADRIIKEEYDEATLFHILDLLDVSYMRSYMTLEVQSDYLDFFKNIGSGWQHILETRLNPDKDPLFDTFQITINSKMEKHTELFQRMCATHKRYTATLDAIQNINELKQPVAILRARARDIVAQSLTSVLSQIEKELQHAHHALVQAADIFKQKSHIKGLAVGTRSISDLLWHYVPGFMMKSFIDFDRAYAASSKTCFEAYLESQHASTAIWKAIEIPRALFYAAHYRALFIELHKKYPAMTADSRLPELFIEDMNKHLLPPYHAYH